MVRELVRELVREGGVMTLTEAGEAGRLRARERNLPS